MEEGVYQHLAKLDAALIIIDCNWNMNGPMISANAPPLLSYFRTHGHATTPIVLAEGTPAGGEWLLPATRAGMEAKRAALRKAFEAAAPTDPHLYYVSANRVSLLRTGLTRVGCSARAIGERQLLLAYAVARIADCRRMPPDRRGRRAYRGVLYENDPEVDRVQ
jgi:hypothetical protein